MKHPRAHFLALSVALSLAAVVSTSAQAQGVRPEVGKPLQQASELLRAGKAKEALAKAREADAVGGKTAAEQLTVDRMKAAAAQRAGDMSAAIQALESIHGKVGGAEQGTVAEQIAAAYAQQRNNGKAAEWLNKAIAAGNNSATVKQLQSYLQSSSGDFGAIAKDAGAAVAAAEQSGRRPDEGDLLRLADAQQRLNNQNGYLATLEKLVQYYPKKDYWSAYLGRLPRKPGFADRFALDLMRLKLANGLLTKTEEFMEVRRPGHRARGQSPLSACGTRGHQARERSTRAALATQATEAESFKEGDALVKVGYAYVSLGEVDKGIDLIQKGITKGHLKRPDDAKLRLGMAQLQSPKTKAAAVQTLRGVKGTEGAGDIARLWAIVGPL
jgi:hypothetical protein